MEITAELVKKLREETGVQMMVCKKALQEAEGDIEKAKIKIRELGMDIVESRSDRETSSGVVYSYNHDYRLVAIVDLRCESDFVAKNEEFIGLAKVIAMHVAWAKPAYLSDKDVPDNILKNEEAIIRKTIPPEKKKFADNIAKGKMKKFFETSCLLDQKELQVSKGKSTIGDMINDFSAKFGEKIELTNFLIYGVDD